ncbi:putative histone-lysine N-methyltransferase ATXR3 [Auxenochlorella protothecoides]|uniref:Putative histone-lysine N-methyltransferase ATXR3 n=1 Tax=Auxenochlorella protothecoides TaxID=3075 RepID=A0A087SSG3_AUXPR|nr:putative histone-lysine N-methyltransferase ATXR3 [Auxenochlorella protothecoides]KFM28667.1 putative histone-lysine N-methyltransferase ATXR3 [Auxenochlorella protothecoides]
MLAQGDLASEGTTGRAPDRAPSGPSLFLPASALQDHLSICIDPGVVAACAAHKQRDCKPRRARAAASAAARKRKAGGDGGDSPDPLSLSGSLAVLDAASQRELFQVLLEEVRGSQALVQLQGMGLQLENTISSLEAGSFEDVGDVLAAVADEVHACTERYITLQGAAMRRGRLASLQDALLSVLSSGLEGVLAADGLRGPDTARKPGRMADRASSSGASSRTPGSLRLPPSILANKEPFRHGEWRKEPFPARPYTRLSEYDILEPGMVEQIRRKLLTTKRGGCDGQNCTTTQGLGSYRSGCACLAANTECDDACGCPAQECLNRAISQRQTLQVGVDVDERDAWGMDCYTRRNIQDAVLDSKAFGQAKSPAQLPHPDLSQDGAGGGGKPFGSSSTTKAAAAAVVAATAGGHAAGLALATSPAGGEIEAEGVGSDAAGVLSRVHAWIEGVLLPAITKQGQHGWDIALALNHIRERDQKAVPASARAAKAVLDRLAKVGYNYFRLHPKGMGLVCKRPAGLSPLTFVEEYLGEIHTPWRWFEIQDAVKKITGDELPDFYNIVLERPKDEEQGYDVLFIDAASKGTIASRMSHSCTPNCQATVMACDGRLTIAMHTLRQIAEGEELTFDYSSVTESEKEFRDAICLCSTATGSYLYYTGSRAFQTVMAAKHNFLHRQVCLLRAASQPLTPDDAARLRGQRVPAWLEKWAALVCEYLEQEQASLCSELLKHPLGIYTEATASAEARGVTANRLQNIVITLDKVKMVLAAPGQSQGPAIYLLSDAEVLDHLWHGPRSVGFRALQGLTQVLSSPSLSRHFSATQTREDVARLAARHGAELAPELVCLLGILLRDVAGVDEARAALSDLVRELRRVDVGLGGGLTALADVLTLYARTRTWFAPERGYVSVVSSPVPLHQLHDLHLGQFPRAPGAGTRAGAGVSKLYRPTYPWGQLSGWYKQTVADPTASLSAERRGSISLPDVESCFSKGGTGRTPYSAKERRDLLEALARRPDAQWRSGTIFSFRNEARVYGSPMLDDAWDRVEGRAGGLEAVLQELRDADVPPTFGGSAGSKAGARSRCAWSKCVDKEREDGADFASRCGDQAVLFEPGSFHIESRCDNKIAFALDTALLLRVLHAAAANDASSLEMRLTMRACSSSMSGAVSSGSEQTSQRPVLSFAWQGYDMSMVQVEQLVSLRDLNSLCPFYLDIQPEMPRFQHLAERLKGLAAELHVSTTRHGKAYMSAHVPGLGLGSETGALQVLPVSMAVPSARASSRQTDPAERLAAAEATGHAAGACTVAKHLSRALLASQFTGPAQLLLGIAGDGGFVHLLCIYSDPESSAGYDDSMSLSFKLPVRSDG